jgi:glycosyltransferase involved in cell wall biosynthesis
VSDAPAIFGRSIMAAPRVTVLTTLYNKGPFVEEAVRSALAQTFTDFELLVVDDLGTDDGMDRVRRFDDPRIRIITNPVNLGRADAANRGFDEARGEYIAILDADDIMMPERLAEQVAFLDAHPEVGALGTYVRYFGRIDSVGQWPLTDSECRGRILMADPVLYPSAMFRKAHLDAKGVRCPAGWRVPGMDYLFLCDLARATRFANLPKELTRHRLGEQNMRHGRDPVVDRAVLYRVVFEKFGIPLSEEELELQLMLHDLHTAPPTSERVKRLHAWCDELIRRVRHLDPDTPVVLGREVQRRWDRLFFRLADRSTAAGFTHLRLSRDRRPDRWRYLLATALRGGGKSSR